MVSPPVRTLAISPLVLAAILKVCTPIQVDGNGDLPLDEIVLPPGFRDSTVCQRRPQCPVDDAELQWSPVRRYSS